MADQDTSPFVQQNPSQMSRHTYAALPRHPLILCASLVHNPANLGGLCRLAEVFRLESLMVASMAIAQDPSFRKTAVSAHHWQSIIACSPSELATRLEYYRQQTYQVIGLDSIQQSMPITSFTFPKCAILLLGQELTGLPTSLIEQCDQVVTIPQYGLIESLNVQHAGAIAIYEYLRQHALAAPHAPNIER